MTETEKEHLKKVYTAYYSQIDFTKDFCEQNIKHITNMQKLPQYSSTPLFKFDRRTTALVYSLHSVSLICKDLMEHIKKEIVEHFENEIVEHIENEIVKLSEVSEVDNDR